MSLNIFETTFLQYAALLSFPDLLLLIGNKEIICKHWENDEEMSSLSRELEYVGTVPGGLETGLVKMTQSYRLQANQLELICTIKYPDFPPLATSYVEHIWQLTEISPEKSSLKISLRFPTKTIEAGSNICAAIETETKQLAEVWYATAQARSLLDHSSLSTQNLARYEEVDLRDFTSLPKVTESHSWLLVYVNSLLLAIVLWYLGMLATEIEERLKEPGCRG